jgi:hypothetical protein
VPVRTQAAVPPTGTGNFGDGVTVKIVKVQSVKSQGTGPGEISGAPSLALTMNLVNGTSGAVSLESVSVSMTYGADATPASPVDGNPSKPFTGTVAGGKSATAVYVFSIPEGQRSNVSVTISYAASKPTVVFRGSFG